MKCLSKGRADIVVIKRGVGAKAIFAIHNMTENKINYRLSDNDYSDLNNYKSSMCDHLISKKYNLNNIELDPFQVIWLGFTDD